MINVSVPSCDYFSLKSVIASNSLLKETSDGTLATPPSTKKFCLIIIHAFIIAPSA